MIVQTPIEFPPFPEQRLAIEAAPGPTLVIAGPGAGKTFCLISRVRHLIEERGFQPARICAVTFTNRAAEEITTRLRRTLGARAEDITRGTLHSLCLRILREYHEAASLRQGFGVADEDYQRILLRRLGVPPRRRSALLTLFSRRRLQHYPLASVDERLHHDYTAHLVRRNLVDFDDLVGRTAELFEAHPRIADAIAGRWDYLLVDEFQDLNPVQYEILKRLAVGHRNLFAVGDDEQSIFSWTGADPRVLVRFREDFGIPAPIVLDRNCRCARQIFHTARRLLAENPQLFDKDLIADRESAYDVQAFAFRDEAAEVAWLLDDLQADRAASGLDWGQYAILYRQHRVGDFVESAMLRGGIPCRLARGRAIAEDEVVGYVIAALRLMRTPTDPVAVEGFAKVVFSEHLLQEVLGAVGADGDILGAVRALARSRPSTHPDTKRLWRFIYQVENLSALYQSRRSLTGLVEELLSQNVGPYRNALEERDDELADPADLPDAVRLAGRLREAIEKGRRVVIEPMGGLEIAVRGLLVGAGLRGVPSVAAPPPAAPGDVVLRAGDGGALGLALTCFKALQLLNTRELEDGLDHYVSFDLETTDNDAATCEIVEIGAARVRRGEIVERFHSLIRPTRSIAVGAQRVHGYDDAAVRDAPPFEAVWPRFRAFVGDDVLVAHNGQSFDVPVLKRLTAGAPGAEGLVFFDTLPLARALVPGSAKLADLAARFGIDAGRAHHALDDAVTLAQVFRELRRQRLVRARKAVLLNLLDYLGLALALEPGDYQGERRVLFDVARFYTLGRYSDALEFYAAGREAVPAVPTVDEVVHRLGGKGLMDRLRSEPNPALRYPAAVARLQALIEAEPASDLASALDRLLDRVALSTSREAEVDEHRVNLLTLHATKGLEFSRVYVVGAEDFQIPGYYPIVDAREDEIQEGRRLLYVGMTRARDRLVLTRTDDRFGRPSGDHRFLTEMGIAPVRVDGDAA